MVQFITISCPSQHHISPLTILHYNLSPSISIPVTIPSCSLSLLFQRLYVSLFLSSLYSPSPYGSPSILTCFLTITFPHITIPTRSLSHLFHHYYFPHLSFSHHSPSFTITFTAQYPLPASALTIHHISHSPYPPANYPPYHILSP